MTITFQPKKISLFLGSIILFLATMNFLGILSKYFFGFKRISIFDLDQEANIPTFYASAAILLCAVLLALIAIIRRKQAKRDYLYWAGLSAVFLFLSIDEFATIHEYLVKPLRNALHLSGIFYFAWVIPYIVVGFILFLVYLRFLFSLPQKVRNLFIIAGIIYIVGAAGFEMVNVYWSNHYGEKNASYALLTSCEEILEMLGILVFIHALTTYIASELQDVSLRIASSE